MPYMRRRMMEVRWNRWRISRMWLRGSEGGSSLIIVQNWIVLNIIIILLYIIFEFTLTLICTR